MREINLRMSNFESEIDDGFADALQAEPEKVFGRHSGWNFNGKVYFSNGMFHEEVWVYGTPKEIISAPNLRDLMEAVCVKYGFD